MNINAKFRQLGREIEALKARMAALDGVITAPIDTPAPIAVSIEAPPPKRRGRPPKPKV